MLVVVGVVAEVTVKFSPSVASPGHYQHLHLNPSPSTRALPPAPIPDSILHPTSPAPHPVSQAERERYEGKLQCNPRKGAMMVWQAEEEQ